MTAEHHRAPAFQFYARDWLADANRILMPLAAQGACIALLCVQWLEGALPADPEQLRRLAGAERDEWSALWPFVEKLFPLDGPQRRNSRLEQERSALDAYHERRRNAARTGAKARWHPDANRTADAMRSECTASASAFASAREEEPPAAAPPAEPLAAEVGALVPVPQPSRRATLRRATRTVEVVTERLGAFLGELAEDAERKASKAELRAALAEAVFLYWTNTYQKPRALLDPKRTAVIEKRLQENGDDAGELLYALDVARQDDYVRGRGPHDGKPERGVEWILRDRAAIEGFASKSSRYRAGEPHPKAVKLVHALTGAPAEAVA